MPKFHSHKKVTGGTLLVTVTLGMLLSACSTYENLTMDSYRPSSVEERYPIRVEKKRVQMGVVSNSGALKPDQVNAVIAFTNNAKTAGLSGITIRYPSGSAKGRTAAGEIGTVIMSQGVPSSMIHLGSYSGGSGSPVQLSFVRKVAVTKECGNWSRNLAQDHQNDPPKNFGCATRHNIAAMVSNPADFEAPRGSAPALADNRMEVMKVYLDNPTAGDYYTLGDKVGD